MNNGQSKRVGMCQFDKLKMKAIDNHFRACFHKLDVLF